MYQTTYDILEDILHRICVKLQISLTQHNLAKERYDAVAKWIANGDGLFDVIDLSIYPQGSLKLGTVVKPISNLEFDLDLVCEFAMPWANIQNPTSLLNEMEFRIRQNGTYSKMCERKKRCIRLNYSGEFHVDILPACPDNLQSDDSKLKVPDRQLQKWIDSNPKGYAKWVEDRSVSEEYSLFEKAAKIEALPDVQPVELKPPLKRVVQLIKRYRDMVFKDDYDNAPVSIVLTTLACESYLGEGSVNLALKNISSKLVGILEQNQWRPFKVLNPTNLRENFSERWDEKPHLFSKFSEFILGLQSEWSMLNKARGLHNVMPILTRMFGETVATEALREHTAFMEKHREIDNLSLHRSSGRIVIGSTAGDTIGVKRSTFFGDEKEGE